MVAPMTTYLVGLDGSDHARDALDWARAVATEQEKVVVLHASDLPVVTGLEVAATVDPAESEEVSSEFVAGTLGELDDPRLDGRTMTGSPGESLVEAAQQLGPDVVIVVGHGGSGKASLLLGSTAHHVIHHTDHPVVVVRGQLRVPVERVSVGIDEPGGHHQLDPHSLAALRWALRLPGVREVQVAHADFVPGVAAGPVREPGLESDEATAVDDAQIRRAIAAGGPGPRPLPRRRRPLSARLPTPLWSRSGAGNRPKNATKPPDRAAADRHLSGRDG
jgi:nucleotide-binding universal stress UspA family protein